MQQQEKEMDELDLDEYFQDEAITTIDATTNGQEQMEFLLETLDRRTSEWIIQIPLAGQLDFACLKSKGFDCIRKIVFQKRGNITGFIALPKNLVVLECSNQKISHLGVLPASLEDFVVDHNELQGELDLEDCRHLIRLNVSNNQLSNIVNIPASLEDLYCNNNQLETLNLSTVPTLKTLHIMNNNYEALSITSLPNHLFDFKNNNTNLFYATTNPAEKQQQKRLKKQINYQLALDEYFRLKSRYWGQEINGGDAKRKCILCERLGGTIFFLDKERYYAKCGVKTEPCSFHIELYRGIFENLQEKNEEYRLLVERIKQEFILLKLNTVFSYIPDKLAADLYKELLEENVLATTQYEHSRLEWFHTHAEQTQKRDKLVQLNHQIDEMQMQMQTNLHNNVNMIDIIEFQVKRYNPLIEERRKLLYDDIFVEEIEKTETTYGKTILHFYKDGYYIRDLNIGEPPAVIHFEVDK